MAVRNPEALYGGNANVFNFTPFIQYSQRQQAIKKAKEDAADNYFRDLTKGLTPTGMAANDIDSFMNKKNQYQQFVLQNRQALRNPSLDKGRAYLEAQYLFNDALEHAEKSKAKVKNLVAGQKLLSNPEMRNRLSENTLEGLRKQGAPVDSQDYADYDYADLNFKAKPFDNKMQQGYLKGATQGLTMGDLIEDVVTDPKTLKATTSIKSTYNPDALQAINSRAEAAYYGDPSVKEFVDANLSNPEMHDRLNNIFKSTYGVDIQNPSELFTAWTLDAVQNEKRNQKISDDKAALEALKQKNKLALEAYKQGGRMALLKKRNQFKKENAAQQGLILDSYIDGLYDEAGKNTQHKYTTKEGNVDTRASVPKTPELMEIFTYKNSDGKNIRPDDIYLLGDGRVQPIFYNKDPNTGEPKMKDGVYSVDETRSSPVSRQTLKFNLGKEMLSTKQRVAEMQGEGDNEEEGNPKAQPKKVSKTKDPLGLF